MRLPGGGKLQAAASGCATTGGTMGTGMIDN